MLESGERGADLPRCGALGRPDGSCVWRVWAPRARQVELVLLDGVARRGRAMAAEGDGYFSHTEPHVAEGQRYAFRLDGGPERPDPCSRWQPDGVHRPSAVLHPERFAWTDSSLRGVAREELVFYELHIGTFTPEGTFDAVIPRLDALRELGVTALELMPVAQFSGGRNWGYDGVHLSAPQNTYGGPHGLARLVDACHGRGLAVFLDVVYNHFGPEGNYAGEFGPYYSERYRTPWGPAFNFDDRGSDPVRRFVLDNVRLWIDDYHLDGLRLDAVHAMFDSRPHHILAEIKETADEAGARAGRRVHVVAESLLNDVRMVRPPERGGYGLDAEWNDDFHHALHAYLTGERHAKYADFGPARDLPHVLERTFLLDGRFSKYRGRRWGAPAGDVPGDRFVVSVQNHDQVGNRARGERLSTLVRPAARRLAASLLMLSPHLPLLFMGEEYGETNPFLFFCSFHDDGLIDNVRRGRARDYHFLPGVTVPDPQAESSFAASRLDWSWPPRSDREATRLLYQDLLAARRRWPALRDFVHRTARLLPDEETAAVLHLTRGTGGDALDCYLNLTDRAQPLPEGAGREVLFSSEARRYRGERTAATAGVLPYECVVCAAK
jgi:maltooligosyltrehalose trehalohydrolase